MAAIDRPPRAVVLRPLTPAAEPIAAAAEALQRAGADEIGTAEPARSGPHASQAVIDAIDHADFVIADVTGSTSNVLFELGYAYGRGKPTLLLVNRAEAQELPFDLRDFRFLIYQPDDVPSLRSRLAREVIHLARRAMVSA
jgi:hypothetical protein